MNSRHLTSKIKVRIYYEDTDFSGVVYHASYLRFMERGRTELLRDLGIHHNELQHHPEGPFAFAVRHMEIDFLKSAVIDDFLTVQTTIQIIKGASIILSQQVFKEQDPETILIKAKVKVAFIGPNGHAHRLPKMILNKLDPDLT